MNDWQVDQEPRPTRIEKAGSGQISLTIAKCIWVLLIMGAIASYILHSTSWVGLFFLLMLLFPLVKLVPIVAAIGVYFGFKESEAEDEREARIGVTLNLGAFILGIMFFFL
jgi:hypothetical protein